MNEGNDSAPPDAPHGEPAETPSSERDRALTGAATAPSTDASSGESGKHNRFVEWLWRGHALAEARTAFEVDAAWNTQLARARCAAELGDRAAEEIDPPRAGSPLGLSLSLYREAAYWSLLASRLREPASHRSRQLNAPRTLEIAFDDVRDVVEYAAGGAEGASRVRRALIERTFIDTAALPDDQLRRDVCDARAFVHALLARLSTPEQRVGKYLAERIGRVLALVLALVAIASIIAVVLNRARGPSLVAGRAFRVSSTYRGFTPATHRVDGRASDVFFHTDEEDSPWLLYDLGAPRSISRVEVTNRGDCCSERAVPLIVEVSTDLTQWAEVARRTSDFRSWSASFAPHSARYVRLRVPKKTWFHLEDVAIR